MRQRTEMTRTLFDCVKKLIEAGSKTDEIVAYLNISKSTINRVRHAETWEEYRHILAAMAVKARKPVVEAPVVVQEAPKETPHVPDRTQSMYIQNEHMRLMREMCRLQHDQNELLKEQNKALALISDKLAYIVTELS